ncbi:MAG: hypothetical protein ACK4WH_07825 [Phycisphaerales bacterium]
MFKNCLTTFALAFAVGASALAQPDPADRAPSPPAAEPPLGGPSVTPRDVPGVQGQFGNSPEGTRRRMAERIPARVLRQALEAAIGEDAPADVRATEEQWSKIREIQRDFEQRVREFLREHRDELVELRGSIPPDSPAAEMLRRYGVNGQGDGGAPRRRARGADAPPMDAMDERPRRGTGEEPSPETRERLRELFEAMPQPEQAMTLIWQELSPAQREAVDAKLESYRERMARQREEMYVRQMTGRDRPGAPDAAPPPRRRRPDGPRTEPRARGGDEVMAPPEVERAAPPSRRPRAEAGGDRRQRLMRLFESMTPEQQDQLLERLEARMREAGAGRGFARPERGQPKPPPDMRDQPLPRPEEVENPE